jgi:DHA1 family multidrug resistance protein-like MFS transporter
MMHERGAESKPRQFSWQRNLVGVSIAMFSIQLGFGFSLPYVALYLYRDFNVHDPAQLALLTGVVAGSVSLSASVVGPIWGLVGDRYGRRPMLLRAIAGAGITIVASGLAPNVISLLATRVATGISAGVSPAGTALVAEGTPPNKLGWALGVTASSRAVGQAVGPILAALLASLVPLRAVFVSGGILLIVVLTPIALLVHEPSVPEHRRGRESIRQAIRGAAPGTAGTIILLAACLGLVFFAVSGMQQLIVLRILSLHLTFAALATGVTFTVFGIGTALASIFYSRLVRKAGFKTIGVVAAWLLAFAIAGAAVAPNVAALVVSAASAGLMFGALFPTLNSMVGLEAPSRIRATVFGMAGSFTSLGNGIGPLVGGTVAAFLGLASGLTALAAAALGAGLLLWVWGREPSGY